MRKHIPNTVTLLNLTAGSVGVIFLFNGNIVGASSMIFLAAVFDFFDGFLARLLGVHSAIGKSLDSLADMISFGLLPGLIVYSMQHELSTSGQLQGEVFAFTGLLIPVLSGLRLAIFNNDEEQKYGFRGLPTPANALFFAAAGLSFSYGRLSFIPLNHLSILIFTVILALLLVSRLPMFAFKFQDYSIKNNVLKYAFLVSALLLLVFFRIEGIALAVLLYILVSVVSTLVKR
ncbi:MAG TPA: CDP-alcohol phosphatidyltransferase family protein [Bacteroidales bacterium]|nr:CDP-alcohol phosphatidyltransferase family protein [Bacteroidales bacterium]